MRPAGEISRLPWVDGICAPGFLKSDRLGVFPKLARVRTQHPGLCIHKRLVRRQAKVQVSFGRHDPTPPTLSVMNKKKG